MKDDDFREISYTVTIDDSDVHHLIVANGRTACGRRFKPFGPAAEPPEGWAADVSCLRCRGTERFRDRDLAENG
jgi:hypothetical protein